MTRVRLRNFRGQQIIAEKQRAVEQALYIGASHILNESNKIAPLDEGPLTQTASVDVDGAAGQASVFYVQKYGPRLHENPQFNFQNGREGKWLEKTVMKEMDRVRDIMANEIRERLGG